MSKKITFRFSSGWVLEHRDDDELPIVRLVALLEQRYAEGMKIENSSLASLTVTINEAKIKPDVLKKVVEEWVTKTYEIPDVSRICTVELEDAEEEPASAPFSKGSTQEEDKPSHMSTQAKEESSEFCSSEVFRSTQKTEETPTEHSESTMESIEALIGADSFKMLMREIVAIAPQLKKNKTFDVLTYQSYLLSINEGYGLSTYLQLFAALLREQFGDRISSKPPIELHLPMPKGEGQDAFKQVCDTLERERSKSVKLLCLDISDWMNFTNNYQFKGFLSVLGRMMSSFIVVFRIPFVDKEVVNSIRYSLNDLVYVRDISLPPFDADELQQYAQKELASYGFTMDDAAWDGFHQRITEEKSDGRFYGLNTVKKILRELLYKKQLKNAETGAENTQIVVGDTVALCGRPQTEGVSGYDMLEGLIGGDVFRQRIEEILSQVELARRNPAVKSPCIHMRFVGNPGTGKTTLARIIGKIFKERGVLRIGNFYEYAGRDFCGRYVGETAPKTTNICRDAYGSVLFIDEAYSLYRSGSSGVDYGREALDTLIAEMENHRTDLVVIMAGYTDEMETLMRGNAGLSSRMPYVIEFPNFTREQLFDIYMSMARRTFPLDDALEKAVEEYFSMLPEDLLQSKEFSNARFVRNLFERTCAKASMRCQLERRQDIVLTKDDFERSIADKEFKFMMQKKPRIGFVE